MSNIRTAILGYGRNGSTMHADAIEKLSELFKVVAICDIDPEALNKGTTRFACPGFDDYHTMLSAIKPELVVIVTKSYQHTDMAIDCLNAGTNVLVTKPMATNTKDGLRLLETAKNASGILMPWLPARWSFDLKALQEILVSNPIGNITEVHRTNCAFATRTDWQTELKYGGGYILNWGPHLIDQPLALSNRDIVCVWADVKQMINPNDGEDDYTIITTTSDGITTYSGYHTSIYKEPEWFIKGDKGTITVFDHEITLSVAGPAKDVDDSPENQYRRPFDITTTTSTFTGESPDVDVTVYRHIYDAVQGNCPYAIPLDEALDICKIIDAAKACAKTHACIQID